MSFLAPRLSTNLSLCNAQFTQLRTFTQSPVKKSLPKPRLELTTGSGKLAGKLFGVASTQKSLDSVEKDAASILKVLKAVPKLQSFIENLGIPAHQKKQLIPKIIEFTKGSKVTKGFLEYIVDTKQTKNLKHALEDFSKIMKAERREIDGTLITATQVDKDFINQISKRFQRSVFDDEDKILINHKVDPQLEGGYIAQVGSYRIDASWRTVREKKQQKLNEIIQAINEKRANELNEIKKIANLPIL